VSQSIVQFIIFVAALDCLLWAIRDADLDGGGPVA
jgi:hypothetical protein